MRARDWWPLIVIVGYALPALVVFVLRRPSRPARFDKLPSSPWLPRVVMEYGYWVFRLPVGIFAALGATPNQLTAASLLVTLAASIAIAAGWFAVGGWLLLLGFAFDAWDGMLARAQGSASIAGEFVDAIADRYADLFVGLGFFWYYRQDALGAVLSAAMIVGSSLVSYVRAKGEASGHDPSLGWMQRHERAVWLGVGTLCAPLVAHFTEDAERPRFFLTLAVLFLVAALTNLTAVVRARWVLGRLR